MCADVTAGHSGALERDARQINSNGHGDIRPGEIAIGVVIGRTSEFFDFFVYGIASVLVFPRLVFPQIWSADPLKATLISFAIFALAFVARPIGSVIFMWMDREHGRGVKLTTALFLLGTCTVALGFVPSANDPTLGTFAPWMLAALRIGQGLAWGGVWDGLASLLALNAPHHKRGFYAMLPQLGAPFGLIVACALFAFFHQSLSEADFYDWGWRYPFFVAFAINVVALFARLRIVSSPEFGRLFESRDLKPSPWLSTFRAEGRNIVIGAFAPLASSALFHMVTVFPLSYVFVFAPKLTQKIDPATVLLIELLAAAIGAVAIVMSGHFADRIGRRKLLGLCAIGIAVFSGFAPMLLEAGTSGMLIFMVVGFILLGLSFGQSSGTVASSFRTANRYTASAITSDLSWVFGAGFAPLAALWLSHFGVIWSGLYLLSGAVGTLVALGVYKELAVRND